MGEPLSVVRRRTAAEPGTQNIDRSHARNGYHRYALSHRFEQDQPLSFGQRGEHEDIRCAVTVLQLAAAVEVTEKAYRRVEPQARRLGAQTVRRRAFAW